MINRKSVSGFLLVLACSPLAAVAGQFSMEGTSNNKENPTVKTLADNLMIVQTSNSGTLNLNDANNPLNGATGGCTGTVLVVDGKPSGSGFCTYQDPDGDVSIVRWEAVSLNESGGNNGKWQLAGGTGKYANAYAMGEYSSVSNEDRTEAVNSISGTLSLP